jgi:hypothetical protein
VLTTRPPTTRTIRFAFSPLSSHSVCVPRRGRPSAATPAQVEEVQRLADEGVSKREIAVRVFGDARVHGRVERILSRPPSRPPRPVDAEGSVSPARQENRAFFRELLDRHRERLADGGELPSLKEIELLMKLERQLEAAEMIEQANALTREPGH